MIVKKSKILDELLVLQAKAGDQEALGHLVQRWHSKLIYQSNFRTNDWEGAKDVVQDVWHWLAGNLHKLKGVANFESWIRTVVDRRSIDWIRKRKNFANLDELENGSNRNFDRSIDAVAENHDDHREDALSDLGAALHALDEESKLILSLYYTDGNSIQSIAQILKIPPGTVKSRLFHAREKIRKTLNIKGNEKSK